MSTLFKEYHKIPEGAKTVGGQEIKMTIGFRKGGVTWATSQQVPTGYYVSVLPVERTHKEGFVIESSGAFTGFNDTLLEVDRQSKKRLEQAIEILHSRVDKYLQHFVPVETETI